jgi:chemotaxis family two-component system sensor histidine kinase/response regulator PixL
MYFVNLKKLQIVSKYTEQATIFSRRSTTVNSLIIHGKKMDREQDMRLQFLDEAEEYIDAIEAGVLTINDHSNWQNWDTVLRAAHSIKGGAAMMGYQSLSDRAHRLEDFLKIIKATKGISVNRQVEADLLQGVDCLRRGMVLYRHGQTIEDPLLGTTFESILDRLRSSLGDLQDEMEIELLSSDAGEDMAVFLFQTEVEICLERLESVLSDPDNTEVREEFQVAAQELAGLGEMLELPNFSQLCEAINEQLTLADNTEVIAIAQVSLQELKRSQALVLIGQRSAIPTRLERPEALFAQDFSLEVEDFASIDPLAETIDLSDLAADSFAFLNELSDNLALLPSKTLESSPLVALSSSNIEIGDRSMVEIPEDRETDHLIRVPTRQLEQVGDLVGELTIDRNGLDLQLSTVRSLFALLNQRVSILRQTNQTLRDLYDRGQGEIPRWGTGVSSREPVMNSLALPPMSDTFDRLEMDRYSDLHSIFQELMETIVQIQEVTSDIDTNLENTQRTARQLTRTSQLLQSQLTRVRMRPFSDLVGRFPRLIRDLSQKYGKSVNLTLSGGEILLDRTIIDMLGDPLLHLLRNAFDHGIEDPDIRESVGKPREGRIELSATYRGSQTIITLRDDGGGIDVDKISAKALQMGLTAEDLTKLSRQDLLNFIFEPGFSTATAVTDLSGRGMGMDIVRAKVAAIRGQIQIDTQAGKGTTFTLAVPFTLSVSRVLLAESGGLLLAFPTSTIEEMIIPSPEMRLVSRRQNLLDWDGYLLPVFNLREHFQFSRPFLKPETSVSAIINQSVVLVITYGDRLVGIEVSAYLGEREVTLRSIEGGFPLPAGFDRCTILGDGRVVPLISAHALIEAIEQKQRMPLTPNLPVAIAPVTPKDLILVVDDSINVRRFLATTLEKAGYRVQQAKDGQEAIEKLQEELPIQAVICDIEMPRLDGYGFLAQARAQFRHLPIFMLTSRGGDKHRQIAFNLGASGYFSKPFQEQELLQTLKNSLPVVLKS